MKRIAIIAGAGPAGLTAAYELASKTDIKPIILEKSNDIGGISKTVVHNGNRMDIGGHRFFSKSDTVMNWWKNIMPIQSQPSIDDEKIQQKHPDFNNHKQLDKNGKNPNETDQVMLYRNRLSRIFFLRKFFDYPVSLTAQTLGNLGLIRIFKIGITYSWIQLFPRREEKSLEDFFINRFGSELYKTFFKDYTEKVWGVPCSEIAADWGSQRIKDLSVLKTLMHALKSIVKTNKNIDQKDVETSLIGQFLYPKLGPGSMWETVAEKVQQMGGEIIMNANVCGIDKLENGLGFNIQYQNTKETTEQIQGDFFFSTMPVVELVNAMQFEVPENISRIANGLQYRDFMTVGLLLDKLKIKNKTQTPTLNNIVPDNWIYIQERDVKVGRLQIFNNWSPYMVKDPKKVWIGLEYFCKEGDELWSMQDKDFIEFAIDELDKIDIIEKGNVLDSTLHRVPKTYPAYFGTYNEFEHIQKFTDNISNLYLIGRNGMHKYNNADHSMLTAITAVENIQKGQLSKANIWNINTEEEYHEAK